MGCIASLSPDTNTIALHWTWRARLALARFSVLVACPGDMIAELDLNPVIAGAEGVLVEPNA